MSLHETWAAAKKSAWKDFKTAQKNYLKEQDKKINATNDPKAKKKALDVALGEAGLDQGESLDDYLKFADGFGKSLDALEKAVTKNSALAEKYKYFGGGIDEMLKDKELAKQLLLLCDRTHNRIWITFYMKDYKKSAQEIYDQYVTNGPDQLDLATAPDLKNEWDEAAADPQTLDAKGKDLIDRLREHAQGELESDVVLKMSRDETVKKNLGFVPTTALNTLKTEVRETAQKYDEQVSSAAKKWKDLKPKFWQPLDAALQEIMEYVRAH